MSSAEPLHNDPRRQAFEALRQLAEEFAKRGRLCYAASAKPALIQRVGSDESSLGYATFRAFLTDAEAEGWVTLSYVAGGDLLIQPARIPARAAGSSTPAAEDVEPASERPLPPGTKIRHDFWNAVVKESQTWLYDRNADAVVTDAAAGERTDLVPLPTADKATQVAWMEAFVSTLDPARADVLKSALDQADDLVAKLDVLTAQPVVIRNGWYSWRTRKVRETLEAWKGEHALDVELLRMQPARRTPRPVPGGRKTGHPDASSEQLLRERLHRAIDQMPMSDLLRLAIPIEFLIDA